MRIRHRLKTLVAGWVSLAIVVSDMSFVLSGARLVAFARGPYNAVSTAMAAAALVGAGDIYAQTPEELGSTSGAVDPDDPEALQAGRSAAAAALGAIQRPGMEGFGLNIQKPDGTYWVLDMGARADGTTYTESDLEEMRQSYGDPLTAEEQAEAFESDESQFMLSTFQNHGHTGVHSEPGIVATEEALRQMEDSNAWQDLFGKCGTIQRENQDAAVIPDGDRETCYRVEAAMIEETSEQACQIENHAKLSADETTAAMVVINRMSVPTATDRQLILQFVRGLDHAANTSLAVYAFPADGIPGPVTTIDNGEPTTYARVTGWGESVEDPSVAARYGSLTPMDSASQAAVMDHLAQKLANRSEERKLMIVFGHPNGDMEEGYECQYTDSDLTKMFPNPIPAHRPIFREVCYTDQVIENWSASVTFVGFMRGGGPSEYQDSWDEYDVINGTGEVNFTDKTTGMLTDTLGWYDVDHVWTSDDMNICVSTAEMIESGEYDGTLQCTRPPNNNGCNDIDGLHVCEGPYSPATHMLDPPITTATDGTTIGKACGQIATHATNIPELTSFCWTGVDGVSYCEYPSDEGVPAPLCDDLPAGCGRIESTCVESTRDEEGHCHVYFEEYSCGRNTDETVTTTAGGCSEPIPCMDGECMDDPPEQNENWVETFAMLQAVEWAGKDAENCNVETAECPLFPGEQMYCRKRKTYIDVPCCDDAPYVGLTEYMTAMKIVYKGLQSSRSIDWLGAQFTGSGWWQSLSSGTANVWDTVSQPFVTAYESLAESSAGWLAEGGTETAAESLTSGTIKQELINQAGRFMNVINPDMASFFFEKNAAGAYVLNASMTQMMSFVNAVMWVYMSYQLAQIVFTIFANCDEDDQGVFNVKREHLKVCHVMPRCDKEDMFGITISKTLYGCCFSSPLSRILQEQIRPQLGISWGSKCDPDCSSITLADLQRVDWSLVDLTEWTEILYASGIIPDSEAAEAARSDIATSTRNRDDPDTYYTPDSNVRLDNRAQYVEEFSGDPSDNGP